MGRSYTYDYDDAGNRIQKKEFAFTLGALGSTVGVYQYSYASSGWRDRLTYDDYSYDSISYDAIGNPISIEDSDDPDICTSLRWKGRLLMSFSDSEGPSVSFTYNADGIRTSKTVGGVKHKYTLDGSRIVSETWTKNNIEYFLYFIYDENGSPAGIEYRTSEYEDGEFDYYFFDKNIFGDIIGIYNESGRKICTYTYNAWGECTVSVASGLNGDDFLMAHEYNPFRYRGYYYDIETRYYYLQTRYYNPDSGRFLNADGYLNANGDILGYNMFAYCSNNPISFNDPTGEGKVWDWLKEKVVDPAGKIIVKSVFSVVNMIDPNISTIETGISISMSEGVHISASANIAIDKSGNIGVNYSLGGGGCTSPGASVTRTFSVSSAETIYDLAGWGVDVGGSVMIPIPETPVSVGGGYDFSVGKSQKGDIYTTSTFSVGAGVGYLPVEFHAQVTYTWTPKGYNFNS